MNKSSNNTEAQQNISSLGIKFSSGCSKGENFEKIVLLPQELKESCISYPVQNESTKDIEIN